MYFESTVLFLFTTFICYPGKSTLLTALYRLVNLESGNIEIDGLRLDQVKLKDLRTNISVIPQDPVLFVGTVRYNLDPFDQYDDAQLWKALESTHVKKAVRKKRRSILLLVVKEDDLHSNPNE